MKPSDGLLRAVVSVALDARDAARGAAFDSEEWRAYLAAVAEVDRIHRLAPLTECAHTLETAGKLAADRQTRRRLIARLIEDDQAETRAHIADAYAILRESTDLLEPYVEPRCAA